MMVDLPLPPDDDGVFDDYPVDQHSCKLLGPTALVVQGLMGILVVLSLVYKRHRESPKRPWRIWLFDVSKQVAGQMFVHGVNVLISGIVAHFSSGNACVLYFLNILLDTTLGVAIIYLVLHVSTYVLTEKFNLKGFESGKYGNPPSMVYWIRQTAVYVFSLTTMKLSVVALFALWPGIFKMGEWLLSFLGTDEAAQVIFTMGLFPIMMNIVQFWLIDSIVKASAQNASVALPTDSPRSSGEEEPLFQAHSDDEDGDLVPSRPHDIENPPIHARSVSKSRSRSRDPKLSISTGVSPSSTAASPSRKDLEHSQSAISLHAYPPPGNGSGTVSPASSSASIASGTSSNTTKRRRRSPPPPLHLQPRSPLPPAVNATPDLRAMEQEQQNSSDAKGDDGKPEEWAWDEEGGDTWDDRPQHEDGAQIAEGGPMGKAKGVDKGNEGGVGRGQADGIRT
ncbi:hypothetical protein QCA50_000945 [Cerrena zonata]|uniref:Vacuolar membrane protein n=1 Tax=Cerrena zonata TaxID=2478898 RepID=A0AAW0GRZ5_9APHY